MPQPNPTVVTSGRSRGPLRRATGNDRQILGVAGGVARWLGIDPVPVRLGFVVLTLASGVGVVLYVALAVVLSDDDGAPIAPTSVRAPSGRLDPGIEQAVGVGLVTIGLLLLAERVGLFVPAGIAVPAAVVATGAAVGWSCRDGRVADVVDLGRSVVIRLVVGALLVALGIGYVATRNERVVLAGQLMLAVIVTIGGVALLAGPWILDLGRQLRDERVERALADERATTAAHLHDSVLQTLALIQRRAADPAETVALARRQERELRDWLFTAASDRSSEDEDRFAASLRGLADEVEGRHSVALEVVVVGDTGIGPSGLALVAAAREAVVNAATHAGVGVVEVYGEVEDDDLVVFVRDRGRGFDPATVPADRRGIADSVVGRLGRHGGSAEIHSTPGEGTELELRIPREDR